MTKGGLSEDAVLGDLMESLHDPEEFVRMVLATMIGERKTHGELVMRLGITGKGKIPSYRLESVVGGPPLVAIDGQTHRPWPPHERFDSAENWSRRTMTFEEVRDLLGELRARR